MLALKISFKKLLPLYVTFTVLCTIFINNATFLPIVKLKYTDERPNPESSRQTTAIPDFRPFLEFGNKIAK